MKSRTAVLAAVTAAILLPGCRSLGLDAFPDRFDVGDGIQTGLDPFPVAQNPHGSPGLGLSVWPDVDSDGSAGLGLDAFPYDEPEAAPQPADAAPPAAPGKGGPPSPPPLNPGMAPERVDGDRPADLSGEGSINISNETGRRAEPVMSQPVPAPREAEPAPVAAEPQDLPTLRLKFRENDSWSFRTAMDNTMSSPMFGADGMKVGMSFDMTSAVGTVSEDGQALVTTTIDVIRMAMNNPMMGEFSVDSSDPASVDAAGENPMMAQGLGQLLEIAGSTFTVRMNADGTVAETVDGGMLGQMGGMGGMGGGGDPTQMAGSVPFSMPDVPVEKGLTWEIQTETASPMGTMLTEGEAVVTAWDPATGLATIETDSTIELMKSDPDDIDPDDMQAQMMAMMEIRDATSKATITFDTVLGRIVAMKTTSSMTVESPMTGEMSVDSVITYEPVSSGPSDDE